MMVARLLRMTASTQVCDPELSVTHLVTRGRSHFPQVRHPFHRNRSEAVRLLALMGLLVLRVPGTLLLASPRNSYRRRELKRLFRLC